MPPDLDVDDVTQNPSADGSVPSGVDALISPSVLLGLAVAAVLVGALTFLGSGLPAHVVGYVLCAPVAFSLIALFRRRSLQRLFHAGIANPKLTNTIAIGVLVVGFAEAIAHAWFVARQLA